MIWDPSTLAQLSAPGFNRNIGAGDVVPYWPKSGDPGMISDAPAATPGVSFDPGGGGAQVGPSSFLNNLSALTPILDQIRNQQQAGAVVSGSGNAQAQPTAAATPGVGSGDIASTLGALPIAGAPASGSTTPGTGGMTTGPGNAEGASSAPGAASPDTSAPGGVGTVGSPSGSEGGDGGAGDGGSSYLCTEMYRRGYMDERTWLVDSRYVLRASRDLVNGYRAWACPLSRVLRQSAFLTWLLSPVVLAWSREMMFRMGESPKGSILGRVIFAIGTPICEWIGKHYGRNHDSRLCRA